MNDEHYDTWRYRYSKCKEKHKKHDSADLLIRASAFRATNNATQPIPANTTTKVFFQNPEFDLANEYNRNTSTFIPTEDGIYSISATITFGTAQVNRSAIVGIRVNGGVLVLAGDNDFFGPLPGFANIVSVNTILRLNAGDRVDVVTRSSVAGVILLNDPPGADYTHFEAARFPSPRS